MEEISRSVERTGASTRVEALDEDDVEEENKRDQTELCVLWSTGHFEMSPAGGEAADVDAPGEEEKRRDQTECCVPCLAG